MGISFAKTSRAPEWAFRKGQPILTPEDLQEKILWNPMDKEWLSNIKHHYWATNFAGTLENCVPPNSPNKKKALAQLKKQLELRDRLLAFAGNQACLPAIEEDTEILLAHGEIWLPKGLKMARGDTHRCHENACLLYQANKDELKVATGYYLHADGMWRAHSWCLQKNSRGGRIVETTCKAILYYGTTLTDKEISTRLNNL
jgi:hypothetical protein